MLQRYLNLNGDSGVEAFEVGDDFIRVRFRGGTRYRYSHRIPGRAHVEHMKRLAIAGHGLATYISQNVGDRYESKD